MRIYVTGEVAVERDGSVSGESRFPSRQARLLFCALVCERSRPLSREELAEMLWEERVPRGWDSALKALASKLRRLPGGGDALRIQSRYGCYRIELPENCWVDWDAARRALDNAEGAMRAGRFEEAWGPANVALTISKRGFLPGENREWAAARRRELEETCLRAHECYAEICLSVGQPELCARIAEDSLAREPYRESGYQRLMRAHAALGNRAEAIRVFHRCRELLIEELGVSPSSETEALYTELLRNP